MTVPEHDIDAAPDTFDAVDSPRFFTRGHGGYGRPRVHVYRGDRARVTVGNFVAIEDDVDFVVGGNHRVDWVTTYPLQEMYDLPDAYTDAVWSNGDTRVEHGVAIGRGAKVMPGVHIGVTAQVLPFAVVTRDVPAGAIVVGSPAREVGRRFDAATIDALQAVDWNAPEREVIAHVESATGRAAREVIVALATPSATTNPASPANRWATLGTRARAAVARSGRARGARRRDRAVATAPARFVCGHATYGIPTIHARDDARNRFVVGRYCSIAKGCEVLLDAAAPFDDPHGPDHGSDVVVGNDVWLGMGVRIYPGVTIGDGAVAAAWSVITEDVPPYAIVAGNPARVVRSRFDDDTIVALLRIRWWDWNVDRVLASWRALCSADLAGFVREHDPATVELDPAGPPDLIPRSAPV
jgi:acetyltransferase-like isoleucine patch superfamily enzyme